MHKKKTVLVNVLHGNTWHPKRKVNNQTELLVFTVLGYGQSRRRLQAASSYGMHDTYVMFI